MRINPIIMFKRDFRGGRQKFCDRQRQPFRPIHRTMFDFVCQIETIGKLTSFTRTIGHVQTNGIVSYTTRLLLFGEFSWQTLWLFVSIFIFGFGLTFRFISIKWMHFLRKLTLTQYSLSFNQFVIRRFNSVLFENGLKKFADDSWSL